jgi:hypothetical protein
MLGTTTRKQGRGKTIANGDGLGLGAYMAEEEVAGGPRTGTGRGGTGVGEATGEGVTLGIPSLLRFCVLYLCSMLAWLS